MGQHQDVDLGMSEMIKRVARVMATARGCFDADGAAAENGFPCPFCHWGLEAEEESGCFAHARAAIEAVRDGLTIEMAKAFLNQSVESQSVEGGWRAAFAVALKP